ncbi:MAG: molybdenum cofactor biosynthesis protein MoaE [Bradymonadaceae bacterium]
MELKIVFYGGLRYELGVREFVLEISGRERAELSQVLDELVLKFPSLAARLKNVAIAVGDEIVERDERETFVVRGGQEVALLPPVSGGSAARWLSSHLLDLDALLAETEDPRCGGLVVFSGDIRNLNVGKNVVAITYEAHEAIASKVLAKIEDEVLEQFDVHQCRIQHRVGRVQVGQSSVLVVVRAPHRGPAFDGARYAIDELKERTPIWKEEHYEGGASHFLDGVPLREGPKE